MSIFNLDISDCSIEVLRLKKNLFGKRGVSSFGRAELEEGIAKKGEILDGQKLAEKLGGLIKGAKVNFTLPDLRIFTHRVLLPLDISYPAIDPFLKEKVVEVIPLEFEDLTYDFKVLSETEKGREILFVAIPKKILVGYLKTFRILKLIPVLAVPESIAAFEIFKETVVKDETVLFVDVGGKTSTFSFFDKFGPFLTLNKPVQTKVLKEEVKRVGKFLKEKYDKEIKRVIIGGGRSLEMDAEAFSKEIGIWTTGADKILEDKLLKIPLIFNVGKLPPILFLNVLGLALLAQRKDELNLLKDIKTLSLEFVEEESERRKIEKKGQSGENKEEGKKKKEKEGIGEGEGEEEEAQEKIEEGTGQKEKKAEILAKGRTFLSNFFKAFFRSQRRLILLIIILAALLTFFGIYFLIKKPSAKKTVRMVKEETPIVSSTSQPSTPTPTLRINRKDLKIKVLNGSGIPGEAKEAASILEELGYKVVETANADSYDYEKTVIKIKEEKKNFFSLLTNDLKTHYIISGEEFILPKDEKVEAIIIIGKE